MSRSVCLSMSEQSTHRGRIEGAQRPRMATSSIPARTCEARTWATRSRDLEGRLSGAVFAWRSGARHRSLGPTFQPAPGAGQYVIWMKNQLIRTSVPAQGARACLVPDGLWRVAEPIGALPTACVTLAGPMLVSLNELNRSLRTTRTADAAFRSREILSDSSLGRLSDLLGGSRPGRWTRGPPGPGGWTVPRGAFEARVLGWPCSVDWPVSALKVPSSWQRAKNRAGGKTKLTYR